MRPSPKAAWASPDAEAQAPASSASASDPAHAAAAAAAGRLEQDRVADPLGGLARLGLGGDDVGALVDRDAELAGQGAGGRLVAAAPHRLRGGPDEGDPLLGAGLGELDPLGEEAVAGVKGVAPGHLGRGQHPVDVEVTLGGGCGADADDLVGELGAEAAAVGVGDGEHGFQPLVEAGADDPHRDLAAVGDQDATQAGHGDRPSSRDRRRRSAGRTRPRRRSRPGSP